MFITFIAADSNKSSPRCTGLCRSALSSYVLVAFQCLEKRRVMEVNK